MPPVWISDTFENLVPPRRLTLEESLEFAGNDECVDCPAGRYGSLKTFGVSGLTTSDCTGPCLVGFFCPLGSTKRNEVPCGLPNHIF